MAGWQAVTDATVDNASVEIEAYGTNALTTARYLTVRNFSSLPAIATVTFDTNKWAFPKAQWLRLTNLFDGGSVTVNIGAGSNSLALTFQSKQCTVYAVQAGPPPPPVILMNDGAFGFSSNQFGFNVSALPGQVIVVEAAANLLNWNPLQTNAVPDAGVIYFGDTGSTTLARRFYRARLQ